MTVMIVVMTEEAETTDAVEIRVGVRSGGGPGPIVEA